MGIYVVRPRKPAGDEKQANARLVKAERRNQVEGFLIGEVSIEPASAEEAHELGAAGIKIEDATTSTAG